MSRHIAPVHYLLNLHTVARSKDSRPKLNDCKSSELSYGDHD